MATNLETQQPITLLPGFEARFFHTPHVTIAHWTAQAGAQLPEHSHFHEQTSHLVSGSFELTIDGETRIMQPGDIVTIRPDERHSGKALSDCVIMDTFYPVREDYLVLNFQ